MSGVVGICSIETFNWTNYVLFGRRKKWDIFHTRLLIKCRKRWERGLNDYSLIFLDWTMVNLLKCSYFLFERGNSYCVGFGPFRFIVGLHFFNVTGQRLCHFISSEEWIWIFPGNSNLVIEEYHLIVEFVRQLNCFHSWFHILLFLWIPLNLFIAVYIS